MKSTAQKGGDDVREVSPAQWDAARDGGTDIIIISHLDAHHAFLLSFFFSYIQTFSPILQAGVVERNDECMT